MLPTGSCPRLFADNRTYPRASGRSVFAASLRDHAEVFNQLTEAFDVIERIGAQIISALSNGKKVLWCGNGGSAADSQHLAAEFMGRFKRERDPLPSIALTTDTSVMTAIGNDYGYEEIFRRQVEGICHEGDVILGLSTSGASRNVCLALEKARQMGAFTAAMTGRGGGQLIEIAHECLSITSTNTARVQEAHIFVGHLLCEWVDCEWPNKTS